MIFYLLIYKLLKSEIFRLADRCAGFSLELIVPVHSPDPMPNYQPGLESLSRKSMPFAQEISIFSPRSLDAVISTGGLRAREKCSPKVPHATKRQSPASRAPEKMTGPSFFPKGHMRLVRTLCWAVFTEIYL
jgi:hypothetical protein